MLAEVPVQEQFQEQLLQQALVLAEVPVQEQLLQQALVLAEVLVQEQFQE